MKDKNGYPLRFNGDAKRILLDMGYFDDRPLTDETLKELGFEKKLSGGGKLKSEHWELGLYYSLFLKTYDVTQNGEHTAHFRSDTIDYPILFKTVGGVKLLIEALKGDE